MKIPPVSFTAVFKPYVSLEPAYALFLLANQLSELVRSNLFLHKGCRHKMNSEPDLGTPCDDERAGIDFAASINSQTLLIANLTATALVVLLAAWSDTFKGGRKFNILLPIWLKTAQLVSMCFQSYFWNWSVWFAALTEAFGNFGIIVKVASMVYICSISTNEERIFRMTLLNVLDILVSVISSGSSGFLLRKIGFLNTYLLCTTFALVSFIHLAIFLDDTVAESQHQKQGCAKKCIKFFDPTSLIEAFALFFKKRKGNERAVIWILSLISILTWSSYSGENSVLYLYLRYKFGWNEEDFGLYYLYRLVGFNVGNIICLGMSKYLKISDYVLVIFASFWSVLAAVGYTFASVNWHFYLLSQPSLKTTIKTIFEKGSEILPSVLTIKFLSTIAGFGVCCRGRMFSVHEALNIAVSICFPAYNLLFQNTMDIAPIGAIFILSSSINFFSFILFWICYLLMRTPSENTDKSEDVSP